MPEKAAIVDLDQAIWTDYVRLRNQGKVATLHGISQPAVSQAISRYLATIPAEEKAQHRERTMERYEELYQAHREQALERPRVAAIVRGILDSQARLLGLVQSQVQHDVSGEVEHHWEPGPTVEELMERWRREGKLRLTGELTRMDGA